MTDIPGVSIYIITYLDSKERCQVLEATCRNALEQRYPVFEVVVSDNAGPIPAEEALAAVRDERLRIFRNLGMAGNMNMCVARCRYDILKLNCDDDLFHPDSLNVTVPYLDDETLVINDMEKFAIGTTPEGMDATVQASPEVVVREGGYRKDFWRIKYDALPGNTLMTRKFFKAAGGYDPDSAVDDWDFAVRARLHKKIINVKRVLTYQGVWSSSLTEQMLVDEPFYFSQAGLYTMFNVLNDPSLNFRHRMHVRYRLVFDLIFNGFRHFKNLGNRDFRSGYREYCRYFREQIARTRRMRRLGEKGARE